MKLIQRITVFAITGAILTGCESSFSNASLGGILGNLNPELQGHHERPVDTRRGLAISNNFHMRMLSDDLGRVFYTDHPSRLSPFPIVGLNGNP